nr:cation-transporting P-type ATPase [Planococcus glaciei]
MQKTAWHQLTVQEVFEALQTDETIGLTEEEAEKRSKQSGLNVLPEPKKRTSHIAIS